MNTAILPNRLAWWKYLQPRSAIATLRHKSKDPPRATYWDKCLLANVQCKTNAPGIYKELIDKITWGRRWVNVIENVDEV